MFAGSSALDLYEGRRQQRLEQQRIGQQQAFNKEMYEKRYQMTMSDMRKAGLNPILAYKQGAGASPTSGGGKFDAVKPGMADAMLKSAQYNAAQSQSESLQSTAKLNTAKAQLDQIDIDWFKNWNKNNPNFQISPLSLTARWENQFGTMAFEGLKNVSNIVNDNPVVQKLLKDKTAREKKQIKYILDGVRKLQKNKNMVNQWTIEQGRKISKMLGLDSLFRDWQDSFPQN